MTAIAQLIREGSRRIGSRFGFADREAVDAGAHKDAAPRAPRIVILSASVGSGHVRAARAIESSLAHILPDATIAHVDVLQLTNRSFRSLYCQGYFGLVQKLPHLVGHVFDALDQPGLPGASGLSMRMAVQRANFVRLTRFLTNFSWDLAISTHFLPPEMIAWLRRAGRANFTHATVVTDFDVHGMWINHPCDHYFVATEDARAGVVARGVEPQNVTASGIPIDPNFLSRRDAVECRRKHGLATDRPVVLQLAGGFGIGSIEEIHRSIRAVQQPLQIVAVAGKNADARAALDAMGPHNRHHCRILGHTSEMHELMAAADVVVSKPGGLTTSESLATGCPMVIVEPIPGQEDRNSDFLLEHGCAIKINHLAVLTHKLTALLADRPRLDRMRTASRQQGRPRAAIDIASKCVELLRSRQ